MSLNLVNTVIGLSILTVICLICYRNYGKVITHRRRKNDEDDPLLQYSVIAAFILAIFHLIEGIYFAANWNNNDGYACAELMKGDFRTAGCYLRADEEDATVTNWQDCGAPNVTENDVLSRPRRADDEGPYTSMIDATIEDVRVLGTLSTVTYFLELFAIAGQTLILLFIRRSRLITNSSRLRFWFYGMMYYNLSDWLSVAWIAESNPSVRPLDVCSGPYISASLKHLLLAFKLFYSFTAWRLWSKSTSRAFDQHGNEVE